jgi:hypothetical protein
MSAITQAEFDAFANEINNSGFFNKPLVWRRSTSYINRYQEDHNTFVETTIHTLNNYNYMRSWPITVPAESGAIDRQSIQMIFLKKEISDLGLLTTGGYMKMDTERDRFIMDGIIYKAVGDTFVSQIGNTDLLISIIVKREEPETGA